MIADGMIPSLRPTWATQAFFQKDMGWDHACLVVRVLVKHVLVLYDMMSRCVLVSVSFLQTHQY